MQQMAYVSSGAGAALGTTRRRFVVFAISGLCIASARAAEICSDPDNLTSSEAQLRKSLDYIEAAHDEKKTCSGCAYFTAGQSGSCGRCQVLNGPANAKGHCSSWSART
jgi:hypothetical protein